MPLSGHVPDLDALEILLAVARTGSFNAAATGAGVSQQAVSSRVRSMEAQMGVVLVRRGPRGSQLTADGVVVAEWAAKVLEIAAEFDIGLAALRQDRRSRLRVSASLTVAEQLLPAWLVAFRIARAGGDPRGGAMARPTEIELTAVNSETVLTHVREGFADLGFVEGPRIPSTLRSRVVGHDELVTVVAPTHPWARRRTPLTAAELVATPLVTRERGSGTRDALDAAVRQVLGDGYEHADPAISLSTTTAIRAAVLAGAGPAVLSSLAVRDDIGRGQLVQVPVDGLDGRRALRAVWAGDRQPPAGAARDLIAHIAGSQRGTPLRP
ncbi:LysR family transcriptional regulator [Nakamurella lactea]|uniref:LysR family transcriptional regulator n=1 Tax=Nakamurella lactea TaxID=459515 RepID=UPI000416BAA3|nr:LysR family transcriptional regulator [Nakamurella lactea]